MTLQCFLAARAAKAGSDIRSGGVGGARLRAYCSSETHTWIQKAADISGLGTDSIRWISADGEFRMDIELLRTRILEDIGTGDKPFLIIANAGTVSTGAVDPPGPLASLSREFYLWLATSWCERL
jgi:aromatic-L-amino-acid/L-tryptophan decarboxylase